ncbi:MAG: metal-dependent transcriptional regulator [Candidatus Caldarchaeum sp.]
MPKVMLHHVETTYLKEFYRARERNIEVTTGYLARTFKVKPASAFDVVSKLLEKNMLEKAGWGKFKLTPSGVVVAARIIHNHRILETYFHRELGLSPSEACLHASKIDDQIGEPVIRRMCLKLDFPNTCIHGNEVKHKECREE